MTTATRTVLIVAAAVSAALLVVGAIVGYSPVTTVGLECGAPFSPTEYFLVAPADACTEALSGRRLAAQMLLAAGGIAAVATLVLALATTTRSAPSHPTTPRAPST